MTHRPVNILITGGAGFIASHVASLFAEKYPEYKVSFSRRTAEFAVFI
jgi:nucleoside-diphosphate-sugar epimerase